MGGVDMYLVDVIIEHPIRHLDTSFTYLSKSIIPSGVRVHVPFGHNKLVGYVKKTRYTEQSQSDLEQQSGFKYRWVYDVIDKAPLLNEELTSLCEYLAYSTFTPFIACLKTMLPPSLKPSSSAKTTQKKLKVICFVKKVNGLTPKQQECLNIVENKQEILLKEANISSTVLKKLVDVGAVEVIEKVFSRDVKTNYYLEHQEIILNTHQQNVLDSLISGPCDKPYLLYGVTGSGKTEVYLNATKEILTQGKQVLMLVPEISLTPKMVALFKERFKDDVAILHSRLSDGQRYDEYLRISRNEVKIVVGARSAVFAPLNHIGLIIMDEEHDGSYKQTNAPFYHTRDLAIWRCKYHQAKLLLGSASPSVESYARALSNKYYLLQLPYRATHTSLPSCTVVDMAEEAKRGNLSVFSEAFVNGLNNCIKSHHQALILVNRRGYASYLLCKECGYIPKCPHCDVSLTYHKETRTLDCHYCGYQEPYQDECDQCHSHMVSYKGMGTERMVELLNQEFNNLDIIRYDVDTTRNKESHEKLLNRFETKEANVLLGTQMIAKGLDFKDVTFVGVLDGDGALAIPDYRSAERTFQLILQVAGRSGRHLDDGQVVIQTYNPKHYAIMHGANQDYNSFYKEEIKMRQLANYPPYCYVLSILVSSQDDNQAKQTIQQMAYYLNQRVQGIQVLGPTPALLTRINNQYRYRMTIKYKQSKVLFKEIHELLKLCNHKVKIEVDVNPYSQM